VLLSGLLEDAPAELKPILQIIKSGELMVRREFDKKHLQPLLDLSTKHGVHIIWKDLALIIYASYPTDTPENLIKILEPLINDDRPFKLTALELIAMIYENKGAHDKAKELLSKIIKHAEVSEKQKSRASILLNHISAQTPPPQNKKPEEKEK
jgi:hypothetical protein